MSLKEADEAGDSAWFVSELRFEGVTPLSHEEGAYILLAHRVVVEFGKVVSG
jgi:hypothetical protein